MFFISDERFISSEISLSAQPLLTIISYACERFSLEKFSISIMSAYVPGSGGDWETSIVVFKIGFNVARTSKLKSLAKLKIALFLIVSLISYLTVSNLSSLSI